MHHILPLLDADAIRKNPKWFGGYSDVTALHLFLNQVCGLATFHCTMPSTEPHPDTYTLDYLKKALFGGLNGALSNPEGQSIRTLVPGKAEGVLCGGNLSLLAASLGTPWEVDTKGKILTQLIVPAGKPAVMDLACGHCATTLALPMGRMCRLDANAGSITLEA